MLTEPILASMIVSVAGNRFWGARTSGMVGSMSVDRLGAQNYEVGALGRHFFALLFGPRIIELTKALETLAPAVNDQTAGPLRRKGRRQPEIIVAKEQLRNGA